MITLRTFALGALGAILSTSSLHGQDLSRYREFQLGANLASIAAVTGVPAAEAQVIHLRPALMQELTWRRPYSMSQTAAQIDPVKQMVFSFYNDQLSKIVVDYDRERTAGMTDADLIAAISTAYGPQVVHDVRSRGAVVSRVEQESGTALARWEDADYSLVLYRAPYASGFRTIVISSRLEALARSADAQAIRLDEREAPAREVARQQKEVEDARASSEKARLANKAAFQP